MTSKKNGDLSEKQVEINALARDLFFKSGDEM